MGMNFKKLLQALGGGGISGGFPQKVDPIVGQAGDSLTAFGNGGVNLSTTTSTLSRDAAGVVTMVRNGHAVRGEQYVYPTNVLDGTAVGATFERTYWTTVVDANTLTLTPVVPVVGAAGTASTSSGSSSQLTLMNSITARNRLYWTNLVVGGGIRQWLNTGQGGDFTTDMPAQFDYHISTLPAGSVIEIVAGTNDVKSGAAGSTIWPNLQILLDKVKASSHVGIIYEIPPLGPSFNTAGTRAAMNYVNAQIATYVAANSSKFKLVLCNTLMSQVGGNGDIIAAYTTDDTHLTELGAQAMATNALAVYQSFCTFTKMGADGSGDAVTKIGRIITKVWGSFLTTASTAIPPLTTGISGGSAGAGVASGGPVGWAISRSGSGTGTCTVEDSGDPTKGSWTHLNYTSGAANDTCTINMGNASNLATNGLVVGDYAYYDVEFMLINPVGSGVNGIGVSAQSQGGGAFGNANIGGSNGGTAAQFPTGTLTGTVSVGPVHINASTTNLTLQTVVNFVSAGSAAVDLYVRRGDVRKCATPFG